MRSPYFIVLGIFFSLPYLLNFEGDYASKAVVLMFWVPHIGVSQPARSCVALQLARPNRHDAFCVCVTLQQIERIELERSVEQEFDVVQQQQVARGMLIGQLTQDRRGLQMALSLRDCRQPATQFRSDIEWREPAPFSQRMQQQSLARLGCTNEQNELAVQCPNFIDQPRQFFDHLWPRCL